MMNVSDTRDCAFEAFMTNLGKYNEGFLVGEWVKFPVTNEEMQAVFRRIGIGRRYEEWFITDYDCPDAAIGKVLGEYESLSELNYLAGQIMELRESDDFWRAVLDLGENTGSVNRLHFFIGHGKLHPFAHQKALVVFAEVGDKGFKGAVPCIRYIHHSCLRYRSCTGVCLRGMGKP